MFDHFLKDLFHLFMGSTTSGDDENTVQVLLLLFVLWHHMTALTFLHFITSFVLINLILSGSDVSGSQ